MDYGFGHFLTRRRLDRSFSCDEELVNRRKVFLASPYNVERVKVEMLVWLPRRKQFLNNSVDRLVVEISFQGGIYVLRNRGP